MANTKKTFKEFLSENQNFWEDVGLSLYEDSEQDFVTYKYLKENYYTSAEVDEKISEVDTKFDSYVTMELAEQLVEDITTTLSNVWTKDELLQSLNANSDNDYYNHYVSDITYSSNVSNNNYVQPNILFHRVSLNNLEEYTNNTLNIYMPKLLINGSYHGLISYSPTTYINLDNVYVLQDDLSTTLAEYVTSESLETTLGGYATKEEIISELPSIYVNIISFGMQIQNDEDVEYGGVSLSIIANKEFGERDFVTEIATWLNENGFNSTTNLYPLNPQSYKGNFTYYYCYSEDGSTIMLYNSDLNENNPTAVEGASLENYVTYKLQ